MTDSMPVGRIEQLTLVPNKQPSLSESLADSTRQGITAKVKRPTDVPFWITTLKYNDDGSLSLEQVDEWLRDSETEQVDVGTAIIHMVRAGSDSQAMMVLDRYREFVDRRQFRIDCESECTACGKPDKYYPAVWDEEANTYQHETIKKGKNDEHGKIETCDATLLFFGWELRNQK